MRCVVALWLGILAFGAIAGTQGQASAPMDGERVAPVPGEGHIEFKKGQIGLAAVIEGGTGHALQYDRRSTIKASAGTFELWVKPAIPGKEILRGGVLFTLGRTGSFWLYTVIQDGAVTFVWFNGRFPFRKEGEFHGSVKAQGIQWPADEWHHLAFVWAVAGKGESVMQIYVDGALKAERYNLDLQATFMGDYLKIGCNAIHPDHPHFPGAIDEVRISNCPKTPEAIRDSYRLGARGLPLALEPSTLLLLHFEGTSAGLQATTEALDERRTREAVEKIFAGLEHMDEE